VDDDRRLDVVGGSLVVEGDVTEGEERAFSLPVGTVTFVLSDVEGSTRRWEAAPEAMTRAVSRHYELLDAAIVGHGGVRPVEQGEGDSVVGAFSRASDAVAAAVAVQRAFAVEPWPQGAELRVRIGVHTGEAQLRDGGNYVGQAVNRTARIRAIGHGGQILLSAATAELAADRLPAGVTLCDLGSHRLHDLVRPEHIWQAVPQDLEADFPPPRSLDAFRHNLPIQLSPLIGRAREIAEVQNLLGSDRLVSLIGSAGVGKTRLGLAVAAELLDANPSGVWLVELASVNGGDAVGRAALAAVGAADSPAAATIRQLAAHLGDRPSLLVLDNCEHVIDACGKFVADLLAASPLTRVLTTSREPLGVPGEITFRVPSLPCPRPERPLDVTSVSQYDAVVLFVERARRARPSFMVSEANCPSIAQICHRLDGIPLALELAASRCRQMSVEHIAVELDDRFRLLTGGARTVMARQQTLTASIDWSHDRLDDAERRAFRRLGVFMGPFPLEAAEAVVAAAGETEPVEVFDLVSRLVDKSLVTVDENHPVKPRYRLLETLRAYALDRARAASELSTLRDAHASWWADWLEPRGSLPTDDVLEEVQEFHDNLTTALDWSADEPWLGLRLVRDVSRAWDSLGRAGDAMTAIDRLLTDVNAEEYGTAWLSAAHNAAHLVWMVRGPAEHAAFLDRIATVAIRLGDDYQLAIARWAKELPGTGVILREMAREQGDRYLETAATLGLAAELAIDEPNNAGPMVSEAVILADSSGFRDLRVEAVLVRAEAAAASGKLAECIELVDGVRESTSLRCWPDLVRLLGFAGLLSRDDEAIRHAVEVGQRALHASPGPQVWIYNARHRLELLKGHPSVVDPKIRDEGISRPPASPGTLWLLGREAIDAQAADDAVNWARATADTCAHPQAVLAAIEAAATGDGEKWYAALDRALDHGLRLIAVDALEGLAVVASTGESWAECLRLLAAAERLRDETGYRWRFGFEQRAVDAAHASATEALGDAAIPAFTEGGSLDWHDAAAYARRARGERRRPRHGWASLTPTEQQVVALVADGLTNPQIAERLYISRTTVKTHLEHIFTKLDIRTRAELAAETARRSASGSA
jgi:predicted ATPase/class 3 adenylate cyclase/DNA-binding CsgD family transcriptional regulator